MFHPILYLTPSVLEAMESEEERKMAELQANEFGICPDQLFGKEHRRGMPIRKVSRMWLFPNLERSDTIVTHMFTSLSLSGLMHHSCLTGLAYCTAQSSPCISAVPSCSCCSNASCSSNRLGIEPPSLGHPVNFHPLYRVDNSLFDSFDRNFHTMS